MVLQGKVTVRSTKTFHLSPYTSHLPSEIVADEINGHFAAICPTLPPLNTASLLAYLPSPSTPHAVHEADVVIRIRKFKYKRATTPTDLPIKMYKELALELATSLCSIMNTRIYIIAKDRIRRVDNNTGINELRTKCHLISSVFNNMR